MPRILDSLEDSQHAHNNEMRIENENNTHAVATETPTRDSRNKDQSYYTSRRSERKGLHWEKCYRQLKVIARIFSESQLILGHLIVE